MIWCFHDNIFDSKMDVHLQDSYIMFHNISRTINAFWNKPFADILKIGVLKNFANFTGKHLCWSLFFLQNTFGGCFCNWISASAPSPFSTNIPLLYSRKFHFYRPWKHQKTSDFLMFLGCIEVKRWLKMR